MTDKFNCIVFSVKITIYMQKRYLLPLFTAFLLISCHMRPFLNQEEGVANLSKDSLIKDIVMLSSDSFQGRRPFTPGETMAISYLESQLKSLELEPGNDKSYMQDVPMVEIKPAAPPVLKIKSAKSNIDLQNMTDYVIWTENTDPLVTIDYSD